MEMPLETFFPGDTCYCKVYVCNREGNTLKGHPIFIILDVYGSYFFAPGFTEEFDNYLDEYPEIPEMESEIEVLPEFQWPSGAGCAEGIMWYGAITDPGVSHLVGELGTFAFGWCE